MFRKDRDFKIENSTKNDISGGGGSIIYVKSYCNASLVNSFNTAPDSLAVNMTTSGGVINICCIYRSTSLNLNQNNILLSCIKNICNVKSDFETILLGDFNLPNVLWETGSINSNIASKNQFLINQQKFLDIFNDRGLTWYFTNETTRRRLVNDTLQESLLDQVLYTNDALVNGCKIVSPLGKSDHVGILVELVVSLDTEKCVKEKILKPTWGKISSEELLKFSLDNIEWDYSSCENVEDMWDELHGKLTAVAASVPAASVYLDNRPVKLPWNTSALKRMRKNKDKAWTEFDVNPSDITFSYASSKQNIFEVEEVKAKVKYERKITSNLKQNCKSFYSYLRNKRQVKSSVSSLDRGDGTRTDSSAESAEVLASAFSSVFVREPPGPLPNINNPNHENETIDDMEVHNADVKKELLKLNIFKSSGPDGVHPKLLKSLANDSNFVEAVTKLFKKSSETGSLPGIWKSASVVALFKKGMKSDPLNYRPVSLTCILCKVYEKLVRVHVLDFLEERISKHQHGFVKGKSCLSNLLETFDAILDILDEGAPVDLFYFDFSKAFDTVPHFRLLSKLEGFGVKGKVLDVIKDFLTDRTMRVCVEGQWSEVKHVLSGVPQGSVLGPLLFVLYVNDLPDIVKSKIKLFADDLKLIANAANHGNVSKDIEELEVWESIWLLHFNPSKCKVVHVDLNNNPNIVYNLDGIDLEVSAQEKDLGVITHNSLLWNEQIKACISKANRMICWIVRNLVLREKSVMIAIYKALIRPHLEYCVQLWNPVAAHGSWGIVLELEGVQRRFTRLISEVGTLPYSRRLEILNLTTLAERRLRGDLIETFKASSGLTEYGSNIFCFGRSGMNLVSNSRCNNGSSKVKHLQRSFLPERVIPYWNKLPSGVKNCESVLSFKIQLEEFKKRCLANSMSNDSYFWEISDIVLSKIEGSNYIINKVKHNEYLWFNPHVAKKRFINLYSTGVYDQ